MIHALGWCDMERWGHVAADGTSRQEAMPDLSISAAAETLIGRPVKYYPRMPIQTRLVLIAMSQTVQASRWKGPRQREIGTTAAGFDGCLEANRRYFEDYVQSGRATGRGSLFIHTLATSAVAEAAIVLGLKGPGLYLHSDVAPVTTLIAQSRLMVADGELQGMLALWSSLHTAVCFAVGAEPRDRLDESIEGHGDSSPEELVVHLTETFRGKL